MEGYKILDIKGKGQFDAIYAQNLGDMIQFTKIWFWGFKQITDANQFNSLQQPIRVYYGEFEGSLKQITEPQDFIRWTKS